MPSLEDVMNRAVDLAFVLIMIAALMFLFGLIGYMAWIGVTWLQEVFG